jgi:serine/threonine protein kinase
MGVVWAATHAVTRKRVAVKLLKPEHTADPVRRERFMREARAASAVRHPNIIEIQDFIELEDDDLAMVMDLLVGESLGERLAREGRIPIGSLAPIMLQVLSAVGTAHAAGIVHRDLKPDNVFLVAEPNGGVSVRVLDFGIAKILPGDRPVGLPLSLTQTGAILGTPFYMSPEQIFGEKSVDARADVWSLGVILYECLSGRRPLECENFGQVLRVLAIGQFPPLSQVAADVPEEIAQLVDRMLQRERALRLPSLVEAYATIARHASGSPSRAFGEPVDLLGSDETVREQAAQNETVQKSADGPLNATAFASSTSSSTADRLLGRGRFRSRLAVGIALAAVSAVVVSVVVYMTARATSRSVQAGAAVDTAPTTFTPPAAPSVSVKPLAVADPTSLPPLPQPAQPAQSAGPTPGARTAPASVLRTAPPRAVPSTRPSSTPRFDPYEHM